MSHVGVHHEQIVAADAGGPGMAGRTVNRDMLAEGIVVADLHAGGFAVGEN